MICSSVMTWERARRGYQSFAFVLPLLAACGASQPLDGLEGETGGTGGSSASGGTGTGGGAAVGQGGSLIAAGGSSASGGAAVTGGAGGAGAVAGAGGSAASAGTGSGAMSGAGGSLAPTGGTGGASAAGGSAGAGVCQELAVVPTPQIPIVAIVVDNSSSMYEPRAELFDRLYDALMNPTTGAIKPLEDKVRFGFSSFRSPDETRVPETDDSCAEIVSVPYALTNFAAIDERYKEVGLDGRHPTGCGATPNEPGCGETDWETPTGHSLRRIAADLAAFPADPPGSKKYILFVTDGTPNTCMVANPNCGQDLALKTIQDAYAAGVGTFVVGIGNITRDNPGCTLASMRCGDDHLQDVANAGTGQPVAPPPMSYWYEQCPAQASGVNPGTPQATYAADATLAGTSPFYTATTADELRTALNGLLSDVISCTVEMDAKVTGNPALGTVTVGGTPVNYSDPDGWTLDMTTLYTVTLQGAACETFKSGAVLNIEFPCDPSGNPIAVRR
jgi:hypothetical protein